MFKKILVPTDGSTPSAKARGAALDLAKALDAPIVALYVVEPLPYVGLAEVGVPDFAGYSTVVRTEAQKLLDDIEIECQERKVKFECEVIEAINVDQGILKYAEEKGCDLIVMGSHGRRGLNRLLMGSVTRAVITESKIPVLVIPWTLEDM
ncbi:MAG: universal stress protein [Saezia sp.]